MAREPLEAVLRFPVGGINVVAPRTAQPAGTCADAQNVRVFDAMEGRARGGMRPGLAKYCTAQINGSNRIQCLDVATVITDSNPATGSLSVRTVTPVVVCNGVIATFNTTTVTNATASGSRSLSASSAFMFSAELFGRVYFTDGISYKIWVAGNNTATDWTPTVGSLPGTDGTTVPRLIESWRGRIVLAGLRTDAHNWFMSALGDPLDWNYSPSVVTETQAVTGGVGVVGKLGDKINCMIPYSDDVLLFGCDHSIWQMSGDPQAGGRIDLISDTVGMAFGRPWCKDDTGTLYFFSNRGGVYMKPPDSGIQNISDDKIGPQIINTNLNTHLVRLAWNDVQRGVHVFITPIA